MLKQAPLLLLLLGSAFSQTYSVEVHLDDFKGPGVKCTTEVPKDFACAIFFAVDPPIHDGIDIASVVGGEANSPYTRPAPVIRQVSLILDGTLYTLCTTRPRIEMINSPDSGEMLAFLHASTVTLYSSNGLTVKKRRLRLFGANTSIPISPNPPEPSRPLSHGSPSLSHFSASRVEEMLRDWREQVAELTEGF